MSPEELAELPAVARLAARLCEIPSPSRQEGRVAEAVRAELAEFGAEVTEDDAAVALPAGCGNILGRVPATAPGTPIMLCAHLDTVPLAAPVEVVLEDGHLTNRHPAILGGDDKAAVAVLLAALRRVHEDGRPHAGIELLFTPCEEIGLQGARLFDPSRLAAELAFVYDHTGELGGIVTSAPSQQRIEATFVGRAAHAGIAPEDGRSAIEAASAAVSRMALGRIDAQTTANVGTIAGGTAANVVPVRCSITAEARSRDERMLATQVTGMLDALAWAASEREVDLETRVLRQFTGYRLSEDEPQVALAARALRATGREPRPVASGGGSDVNAFALKGMRAVNLCNGMVDVHTPDERIAVADLEGMLDVTLALIDAARSPA